MRKIFVASVLVFLAACTLTEKQPSDPRQKALQRIDSLENQIKKAIQTNPTETDIKLAMYMIDAYQTYAETYTQDTLSPIFLFKGAQIYEGALHDVPKAMMWYQQVFAMYPKSSIRPMALFHKANAMQSLGDTANAVKNYQRFVKMYPKHDFADDAQGLITLIRHPNPVLKDIMSDEPKKATK